MALRVVTITTDAELQIAFEIRTVVFVDEQKVPMEEELDEFEEESTHLLAYYNGEPCAACRWRFTENGVKLERFAVLKEYRGKQIGSALVTDCLKSIYEHPNYNKQTLYLNAQIDAMPLYAKFGFIPEGSMFLECDIQHMKMVKV